MKNFKFKSITAAILVATTLSGCLKDFTEESITGGEIAFRAPNIFNVESKAVTETSLEDLSNNGFKVLAKVNSDQSTLFNSMVQKENGVWKVPGKKYYFPTGTTMDFYALYPGTNEITLSGDDKKATLDYTVTTNDDLVAASALGVTPTASAIPLEFTHILSQLAFKFIRSDMDVNYSLKSVIIKAPKTGTFDFLSGNWINLSENPSDFPVTLSESGLPISTSATPAGEMMTFIPGSLTANIRWSCSQDGKEVTTYETNVSFTAAQGKKTIIECTLPNCDGDAIAFSVTEDSWEESRKQILLINASDIIPGEFSVNSSGKKVQFSRGNLFWDGSQFKFEKRQYDIPTVWDPNHVGHFYWSNDATKTYAENYIDDEASAYDTFFAADGGAIAGWTVLSMQEFKYLFSNAIAMNSENNQYFIIDGVKCVVLKSDGFSGTVADSYTADEWAAAEKLGLVAMPIAGERTGSKFEYIGTYGEFWSTSTALGWDEGATSEYIHDNENELTDQERKLGFPIRLVRELPDAIPDATYAVSGQTEVSLPKASLPNGALIKIDWGDGKTDCLSNSRGGETSFSHSYSTEYSGYVKLYVPEGSVDFGEVIPDIYKNFTVNKKEKVLVSGIFPLGPFTVNDSGKQVYFSHGNLFYNAFTQEFGIESHQYDIPLNVKNDTQYRYNLSHICRFYWSNDIRVACSEYYENTLAELGITPSRDDKLFAADGGVYEGWTVLSASEWQYILDHTQKDIWEDEDDGTVYLELPWVLIYDHGARISDGYVITPEGFTGTLQYEYTVEEWAEVEREYGLVFLPDIWNTKRDYHQASSGEYYWSTSLDPDDETKAASTCDEDIELYYVGKDTARGIRLVKVIDEGH